MQVHRSTSTTPFDLVLTHHPNPITVRDEELGSSLPISAPEKATTAQFKGIPLRRLREKLRRASVRLTKTQQRYKQDFDKSVRFIPIINVEDSAFLDRPLRKLDTVPVEIISQKLLPRGEGPFKVIASTPDTVILEMDGLRNTSSIDRVTRAPTGRPYIPRQV